MDSVGMWAKDHQWGFIDFRFPPERLTLFSRACFASFFLKKGRREKYSTTNPSE
jgi:hypothetical protein